MKKNGSRDKRQKPEGCPDRSNPNTQCPIPAYIQEFWNAMKPLVWRASNGWIQQFVETLAQAAKHMSEHGAVVDSTKASMGYDAGKIHLLSMFLIPKEREAILDLIESVLHGDKTASSLLNVINLAFNSTQVKHERLFKNAIESFLCDIDPTKDKQ